MATANVGNGALRPAIVGNGARGAWYAGAVGAHHAGRAGAAVVARAGPLGAGRAGRADAGGAAHLVLGALLARDGAAALRAPQVGPAGAAHLRGADPVHDADLRADLQLEHGLDGGGVGVLMLIKAASKVA